jgi:hypothetical protein
MTLQAPAIIGARREGIGASEMVTWLRGIGVRQVRIACGLIMFSYIFSHFFNHALGNISYATMNSWLWFHIWWWRIPIVNFTLYAAAATHLSLGLWALYQRRHFRYTAAEITQLVLGFSIRFCWPVISEVSASAASYSTAFRSVMQIRCSAFGF